MKPADWLPFLVELADAADVLSLERFRTSDLRVEEKPDASLVTDADLRVEARVRELVRARHPDLGVLGEEEGEAGARERRLVLDPIDGTYNYARGIPVWATLLAIEADGEVVAGLVSAPALCARWHAARGRGAYRGERRLRVSAIARLEQALLFHGSLQGSEARTSDATLQALARRTARQRGFGDFWQHVLVAEGCGEVAVDPVVRPWDIAPLQVIVEEAGGRATSLAGTRDLHAGSLVSSNGRLHDEALAILRADPARP